MSYETINISYEIVRNVVAKCNTLLSTFYCFTFTICYLLFANSSNAQQMTGLFTGNHNAVYRATFNPSTVAGTRYKYQINTLALNSTINNRYFKYFRSDALFHPFKSTYSDSEIYGKSKLTGSLTQGENVNVISEIRGPSAYFDIKKRLSLGFHTRMRGFVQGSGVPTTLADVYTKRLDFGALPISNGSFKSMVLSQQTFFETGFSVAGVVLDIDEIIKLKVGATLKYLSAARNVYLKINSANYVVRTLNAEESNLDLSNISYEYGYTKPMQGFTVGSLYSGDYGSGWGYDFGLTMELGEFRHTAHYRANYKLRIGVALTDGGTISYPLTGKVYSGTLSKITFNQDKLIALIDNSVKGLEANFPQTNSDTYALITTLPQTLNVDLDLHLSKSMFLNLSLIDPTSSGSLPSSIQQPRMLSITPRFEDADADFTLPITWIEGNEGPAVGFSARFGPVFIGFSNFSGLLNIHQPRTTMVYLGLNLFKMKGRTDE